MLVWCSRAAACASRSNRRTCLGSSSDAGRQHLQRHPPAQRLLLGLVDDAHAAPADLAEDAVVAQPLQPHAHRRAAVARPASRSCRRSSRPGLPSSAAPGRGRGSRRPARGSARRTRGASAARPAACGRGTPRPGASTGLRSSLEVVIGLVSDSRSPADYAESSSVRLARDLQCSFSPGIDDRISLSRFKARM